MNINNKKIRGWIIRILSRAYPVGLEGKSIYKQLHDLGYTVTRRDFDANMAYVVEDGFVEERQFGKISYEDILQNKVYKLTTKGVDLEDGTISDDGVEL